MRVRKKSKSSKSVQAESDIEKLSESSKKYIKAVIEGLDLGNGEFLLAVAWATADGRRFHQMYPDVLGLDVVFGTNTEKRPMMRGVGKSTSNRNLPVVNAYFPSQQAWVMDWFVNDGLPEVLDPIALYKTKLIVTDKDRELSIVLDYAFNEQERPLFRNAKRRTCKWHKVSSFRKIRTNNSHFSTQLFLCCVG